MSRPLRLHFPGVLLHVFARGNNKQRIFRDDEDCSAFLAVLSRTLERFGVECVMYCLLGNHYHLLLVPHEHAASRLMQQLNATYCQRFNRRHGRVGHTLQGRFGSRLVQDGEYARAVLRYLALNPVAAGLVTAPEDWPWSSYRAAVGIAPAPHFLSLPHVWKAFRTSDPVIGRERLINFVRAAVLDEFPNPMLHGDLRLAGPLTSALEPHQQNRDFLYASRFATRPALASLLEGCVSRISIEDAVHRAFQHGYALAAIGDAVSRDPSTIYRWIRRAAARVPAGNEASPAGDNRARIKI